MFQLLIDRMFKPAGMLFMAVYTESLVAFSENDEQHFARSGVIGSRRPESVSE